MAALDKILEMKASFQAQVDALNEIISEMQSAAPSQADMDALSAQVKDLAAERDSLRKLIQAEIDDEKTDTARLEAALAPVVEAPVPVVPAPAADVPAPAVPAPAPEAVPAPVVSADPVADPSAATPAPVNLDTAT